MERRKVLDQYFDDLIVEKILESNVGWEQLRDKPSLWKL
jgi:hypothetical protein